MHEQPVSNALREHLAVCDELLRLAQTESDALRQATPFPTAQIQGERKALLERLQKTSGEVAAQRNLWAQTKPPGAEASPELAELVQATLDRIMRVLVIDRENEQAQLRRGLLPPRALPRAEQSQPHFVARTYQRNT